MLAWQTAEKHPVTGGFGHIHTPYYMPLRHYIQPSSCDRNPFPRLPLVFPCDAA